MELTLGALGTQSPSQSETNPKTHTCRPICSQRLEIPQCTDCGCLIVPPQFWNDAWRPYVLSSNAAASRPAPGEPSIADTLQHAQSLLTAHDFFRKDFPYAAEREAALALLLRCRRTFPISAETYHTAVAFFDAVCGSRRLRASDLLGIAEVCLYLSIKANECSRKVTKQDAFQSKIGSKLGQGAFSELELSVAAFLNFRFRPATPFAIHNLIASVGLASPADFEALQVPASQTAGLINRMNNMCLFLIELSCRWYSFNNFPPATVAVACLQLVREDCGMTPSTPELDRLMNVSPEAVALCSSELRKLLRFYRLQFTRCLGSVLTRWIRPDLVIEAHQENLLTFLSEFFPLHPLRASDRPQKKIRKLSSIKRQVWAASEAPPESPALRRLSVLSLWNSFHEQVHLAAVDYPGVSRAADTRHSITAHLKLFL